MAQTAANIHVGPIRLFAGVTNPTSGTPPTLMTHTSGVPATGTEVGYTDGAATVEYVLTKTEIMAEQNLAAVDIFVSAESIKLTCNVQEAVFNALKLAFDTGIGNVDDGTKTLFYTGGNVPTPMTTSIFFSSPRRDNPTKFFVGLIYKAYSAKGWAMPFTKSKASIYPLELHGILDGTRNAGDQLAQIFREK